MPFTNVIELDENGEVLNTKHAEKRAVDQIRSYCAPNFKAEHFMKIGR
ncbi:DUF7677 family protein [Zhouia spongiae]